MLRKKRDADPSKKKCTDIIQQKKDWEDVTCSVCMEFPHNAVLLLCSSHDKGCRPFMCGTSCRYSNCLDQYKKACLKVTSEDRNQPLHGAVRNNRRFLSPPVPSTPKAPELACPLCRGQVKGWTVVESAREFLNGKKRACMEDDCTFLGIYKELRKHVRSVHPSARPREVDPAHEQNWERLDWERERDDVISTVTTSTPGSIVFGDYVIERNGFDMAFDFENDDLLDDEVEEVGRRNDAIDGTFFNMFLLLHRLGPRGVNMSRLAGLRRRDDDGRVDSDDDGGDGGTSLVSRLRRQGMASLGRSGRRRQHREANGGQF